MRKRACDCAACKAAAEAEFFDIVRNPANGQWFDKDDPTFTLEERLAVYGAQEHTATPQ